MSKLTKNEVKMLVRLSKVEKQVASILGWIASPKRATVSQLNKVIDKLNEVGREVESLSKIVVRKRS